MSPITAQWCSYHAIPYCIIPYYYTVPHHTISYSDIQYHTIHRCTIPYYKMPYHTILHRTTPYYSPHMPPCCTSYPCHSISHHPEHTMIHHTILYRAKHHHTTILHAPTIRLLSDIRTSLLLSCKFSTKRNSRRNNQTATQTVKILNPRPERRGGELDWWLAFSLEERYSREGRQSLDWGRFKVL